MTAHEITGDQRLPFQHERELARRLAPVHFEHAQTGYGLVPIAEPVLAQKGEASAFGPRPAQRGVKLLCKVLRATGVVGVGDDNDRRAAKRFEVCAIVFTHWQRVDEDVAVGWTHATLQKSTLRLSSKRDQPKRSGRCKSFMASVAPWTIPARKMMVRAAPCSNRLRRSLWSRRRHAKSLGQR